MYIMYPIAYPTACALDYFLGESHGTIYKKAGLLDVTSIKKFSVFKLSDVRIEIIGITSQIR